MKVMGKKIIHTISLSFNFVTGHILLCLIILNKIFICFAFFLSSSNFFQFCFLILFHVSFLLTLTFIDETTPRDLLHIFCRFGGNCFDDTQNADVVHKRVHTGNESISNIGSN